MEKSFRIHMLTDSMGGSISELLMIRERRSAAASSMKRFPAGEMRVYRQ